MFDHDSIFTSPASMFGGIALQLATCVAACLVAKSQLGAIGLWAVGLMIVVWVLGVWRHCATRLTSSALVNDGARN